MKSGVYSAVSLSNFVSLTCLDTDYLFFSISVGGVQYQACESCSSSCGPCGFWSSLPMHNHQTSAKSTTESSGKRNPPGITNWNCLLWDLLQHICSWNIRFSKELWNKAPKKCLHFYGSQSFGICWQFHPSAPYLITRDAWNSFQTVLFELLQRFEVGLF